jgi:hypothetical protein
MIRSLDVFLIISIFLIVALIVADFIVPSIK